MTRDWTTVRLPSGGAYYGGRCPDGDVRIAAWTTAEEEMLVRGGVGDGYEMFDRLLAPVVELPNGMTMDELLPSDQFFLLVQVRIQSFFAQYTIETKCAGCSNPYEVEIDLSALSVRATTLDDAEPEPFVLTLPRSKHVVGVRFGRVGDARAASAYAEQCLQGMRCPTPDDAAAVSEFNRRKREKTEQLRRARQLAGAIATVDGQPMQLKDRIQFVEGLALLDARAIARTRTKYETGLIPALDTECPKCGRKEVTPVPMTRSFLDPSDVDIDTAIRVAGSDPA